MNPIQQAIEALRIVAESGKFQCHDDKAWDVINDAFTSLRSLQKEAEGVELPKADFFLDGGSTPCWYESSVRTAVAAALGRGAVPSGWKLVPVEPTPEMRKAAADAWLDCDSKLFLNKAGAAVRAAIAISKESA